jgi:hypothetical protein
LECLEHVGERKWNRENIVGIQDSARPLPLASGFLLRSRCGPIRDTRLIALDLAFHHCCFSNSEVPIYPLGRGPLINAFHVARDKMLVRFSCF